MRYTLINDLENTYEFVDFDPETCHAEALSYLGYAILPVNEIDFKENGDVQEYACVDKNDLSTVFSFFGQWEETACIEALSRLDCTLYEGEHEQALPLNVIPIFSGM